MKTVLVSKYYISAVFSRVSLLIKQVSKLFFLFKTELQQWPQPFLGGGGLGVVVAAVVHGRAGV